MPNDRVNGVGQQVALPGPNYSTRLGAGMPVFVGSGPHHHDVPAAVYQENIPRLQKAVGLGGVGLEKPPDLQDRLDRTVPVVQGSVMWQRLEPYALAV